MPHMNGVRGFSSTSRRLGGFCPTWFQYGSIWIIRERLTGVLIAEYQSTVATACVGQRKRPSAWFYD